MPETDVLLAALRDAVGAEHVLDPRDATGYLLDQRGRRHGRAAAVVRPASTEEVSAVVVACRRHGAPVVPIGGNTGLAGGATADDPTAVVVSLERLSDVAPVDVANRHVAAGAGATIAAVRAAARAAGLDLPVRFGAADTAQVGGALSTNVGGTDVIRHGSIRRRVLGLEVVLSDGRVLCDLRGLRKDNAGYAWAHVFVGAEGTLGIVTAACLDLVPLAAHRATALIGVVTVDAAVELLTAAGNVAGETIEAFEVVDRAAWDLVAEQLPEVVAGLARPGPVTVLVEVATREPRTAESTIEAVVSAALDSGLGLDAVVGLDEPSNRRLWAVRDAVSHAERTAGPSIKHDVSVASSRVGSLARAIEAAVVALDPAARLVIFGHVGDGNLHANVLGATVDEDQISDAVYGAVAALGGSISAEHGIGRDRRAAFARFGDQVAIDVMRAIKQALDPDGIMNPGAVLES